MICITCQQQFTFSQPELDFYNRTKLPPSPQCHDCRLLWQLQWRNELTLYSDKCASCQASIVSRFNPKNNYKVYCHKCFNGDSWSALDYGTNFDFSKTFTENFTELFKKTPKHCLHISEYERAINSDYINYAGICKNSYLLFNASYTEDVYYSRALWDVKDSVDCYFCDHLEIGYENINVNDSYGVFYSQDCYSCRDCWLCLGCVSCSDCFGCVNLINQKFCWFNEQLSQDDYKKILKETIGSHNQLAEAKNKFIQLLKIKPRRENINRNTIDSLGNYLIHCKGCSYCLESQRCEDCLYCYSFKPGKDSYSCFGFGLDSELLYETVACGHSYSISFSTDVAYSENVEYSYESKKLKNCFGCAEMYQGGEYCIFNKKYSPEDYNILRDKIVKHMRTTGEYGLFLQPQLSPYGHNETLGNEYFPLTKDGAVARGLKWENEMPGSFGQETLKDLPDNIAEVGDDITKEVLACANCSKNYKIIPQELKFYRQHQLPLPRKCFNCRHLDRVNRRGPWKPTARKCDKCAKEIQAYFSADYPGLVYCEECYRKEVY